MKKLTKDEKIISLFMAVQYKYFEMGMSESAQNFYSNLLVRISRKGGSPKGEVIDILNGFLNVADKFENKMIAIINLDDFPKTKEGKYYADFLVDKTSTLQRLAREYIKPILTEEKVNNILDFTEEFKNEILKKYNGGNEMENKNLVEYFYLKLAEVLKTNREDLTDDLQKVKDLIFFNNKDDSFIIRTPKVAFKLIMQTNKELLKVAEYKLNSLDVLFDMKRENFTKVHKIGGYTIRGLKLNSEVVNVSKN